MKRLLALLAIGVVIVGTCSWLTLSTSGLQCILQTLAKVLQQPLSIKSVQGRLIGPLILEDVRFATDSFTFDAKAITLDWQPKQLWHYQLAIRALQIRDANIHLKQNKQRTEHKIPNLLPPTLLLHKVQLHNIKVWTQTDMPPIQAEQIALQGWLQQSAGHIHAWQGHLCITNLKPGHHISGNLNLALTSAGQQQAGWLKIEHLQGEWQNRAVKGLAEIHFTPHSLSIKQLQLNVGDAWLQSAGQLQQTWQLHWQLHIPHLQSLLPHSQGSITSQGLLTGSFVAPQIQAQLQASNLHMDNLQLAALEINMVANKADSQFLLNAKKLSSKELGLEQLSLQGSGNLQQHRLITDLVTTAQKLHITLAGHFAKPGWQAKILAGNWRSLSAGLPLPFTGQLAVKVTDQLSVSLQLQAPEQEQFSAILTLPAYHFGEPLTTQQAIHSQLRLQLPKLQRLPLAYPLTGQLQVIANVNGTIAKPTLQGQAKLFNAALALPNLGIKLEHITATAEGDPLGAIRIQGQAYSDRGKINVQGFLKPVADRADDWQSDIAIKGSQVLAYKTPEYQIYISPDLHLTGIGKQLNLQGSVVIPTAQLRRLEDKSQLIKPSADIEYADAGKTAAPIKLTSHVLLILGDDVKLDMYGLQGRLVGHLLIQDSSNSTATGIGEIAISNGKYQAYGQQLAIQKGCLLYHANPLNNPGLNFTAIKTAKITPTDNSSNGNHDYQLGVNIHGSLLAPQAQLFSDPADLAQADILSYLLFNKPSSEAASPQALLQLLSNFSGGGSKLTQLKEQIQRQTGLDELNVETSTTKDSATNSLTQQTALALGKALSPRLYLRYSMGLLDPVNTLTIRYLLSSKWTLQSTSSTNGNGVDILYEIER